MFVGIVRAQKCVWKNLSFFFCCCFLLLFFLNIFENYNRKISALAVNCLAIIIYTGQKNLSPTCILPIGLIQKQLYLFYSSLLLDLNCRTKFSVKKQRYMYFRYTRFRLC